MLQDECRNRISVIIPSYNAANTVRRAIDSALLQSYEAYEIIVVDDGSVDDTRTIVRSYGSPVKLIEAEHAGVSSARNTGIEASKGEWIAFLDADDLWDKEKLQLQLHAAEQAAANVVVCGCVAVRAGHPYKSMRARGKRQMFHSLLLSNGIATPTVMVRREAIENPKLRFPVGVSFGEDWQMWIQLASRHEWLFIPDVLVTVYRSDNNCTAGLDAERFSGAVLSVYNRLKEVSGVKSTVEGMWPKLLANVEYIKANYLYDQGENHRARAVLLREIARMRAVCSLQLAVKVLFVPLRVRNLINSIASAR